MRSTGGSNKNFYEHFLTHIFQIGILLDAPEMQSQLVSAHGMLAILEVLEAKSSSRDVTTKLLQIINLVC